MLHVACCIYGECKRNVNIQCFGICSYIRYGGKSVQKVYVSIQGKGCVSIQDMGYARKKLVYKV